MFRGVLGSLMQDHYNERNPAAQAMFWVAAIALFLAYVVEPGLRLWCAIFAPSVEVPKIDLSNMWVPVFTVTGVSGLGVVSQFVSSRERRKDKELEIQRCSSCPTADCAACPLKKDKA